MSTAINREQLIHYLSGGNDNELFAAAAKIKAGTVGGKVYLRGLIEVSNVCRKDCLYCGIRKSNPQIDRYTLSKTQIMSSIDTANGNRFGSIVLQSGEQSTPAFVDFIEDILVTVAAKYPHLGVTLSLGEQSDETYRRWRAAGAHRYLLRIESSCDELYKKIHPSGYSLQQRINALKSLKSLDYQVGSGVMIGLPYQSIGNLSDDLLTLSELDIDMCGMGPYVEQSHTPLSTVKSQFSPEARVELTLRMVALLRIMMPDINIAATTATETLDADGRKKSVAAGANVIMPNLTPADVKDKYCLYNGKTSTDLSLAHYNIAYGERGDSPHYTK